jgi:hypothetical protein
MVFVTVAKDSLCVCFNGTLPMELETVEFETANIAMSSVVMAFADTNELELFNEIRCVGLIDISLVAVYKLLEEPSTISL